MLRLHSVHQLLSGKQGLHEFIHMVFQWNISRMIIAFNINRNRQCTFLK